MTASNDAKSASKSHDPAAETTLFDKWKKRLARRKPALYRDGIPAPATYWQQPTRVLFAFKEPNIPGQYEEHDLRKELAGSDFEWQSLDEFWARKVSLFAHAVSFAVEGQPSAAGWMEFQEAEESYPDRLHGSLLKFGYIQLKKTGGGGTSVSSIIRQYVAEDKDLLQKQILMYDPDLIIGCGVSSPKPASLLVNEVFSEEYGDAEEIGERPFRCWCALDSVSAPTSILEFYHPSSWQKKREQIYRSLHSLSARAIE